MRYQNEQTGLPKKLVYLVIAFFCIMLGFVGLVIPVIPGILFLVAAVFMLGKVSGRFKYWSEQQPLMRKFQMKMRRLQSVDIPGRVKVVMLMSLEMIVSSLDQVTKAVRRVNRKVSR